MAVVDRVVSQAATLDGVVLPDLLSASVTLGYETRVPKATIVIPAWPAVDTYMQELVLTLGAGNNVVRFRGLLLEYGTALSPKRVQLTAYGRLHRAVQYVQDEDPDEDGGLLLEHLVGGDSGTDVEIVQAVLNKVAARYPDFSYVGGNIGGVGRRMGRDNPDAWLWPVGMSALDYIQQIDRISLGYRLYETAGGVVHRKQIKGRPRDVTDFTFTQGVDIFAGATGKRTLDGTYSAVKVTGFDDGWGPMEHVLIESNPFMPPANPVILNWGGSNLLEWSTEAEATDAGYGMSCEEVATWVLEEVNREHVEVSWTTHRDDLLGPGATVLIDALDRLHVGEPVWLRSVSIQSGATFRQMGNGVGGGLPESYVPPPW